MALFEQHPPHVRRKIALVITSGFAVVLVALMVFIYSTREAKGAKEPASRLRTFYTTILEKGQSYFEGN